MRSTAACGLAAVLVWAGACAPPAPDLVLLNAHVFTADAARPWAEALAVRGERIVAIGTSDHVRSLAGDNTVRRDLGGRAVVPGFNDAHVVDPGLTASDLPGFARAALASGVTSMQWFVGGRPVRDAGNALVQADTALRYRLLRMPRPAPDGSTVDSRPHLPPQPSPRVDIRGMGFAFGDADGARLDQAVSWAYGTEDLLAVEPGTEPVLVHYVEAVERVGLPEVWSRKRPRIERAISTGGGLGRRIRGQGMVVVQWPDGNLPLASVLRDGGRLALGSGRGTSAFAVLAWATSPERGAEALTMEQAVTALTRGAAYAELSDRDKGHLTVGALADLAVLSVDPFRASPDDLRTGRSVLTVVGGRPVHDVP